VSVFVRKNVNEMSSACWCSLLSLLVSKLAQVSVVCHGRYRLLHLNQTSLHPFLSVFTTGPQLIPKGIPHTVRFSSPFFSLQYLVVSFRPLSRHLRLLPRFHSLLSYLKYSVLRVSSHTICGRSVSSSLIKF